MARVPYVETDSLPPHQRHLAPPESHIFRALANSPLGLERYRGLTQYIRSETHLDPRIRELALIQIGYVANCPYEYTHHIKSGLRSGVTPEDLYALADESAGRPTSLDPLAKAVLRAARDLTLGYRVNPGTLDELQRTLGNESLLELLFSISTYTATCRLLLTLEVDLEDEYRPYLEKFPIRTDAVTAP